MLVLLLASQGCSAGPLGLSIGTAKVLQVGVSAGPDSEILDHVDKALAPAIGLDLETVRFPNSGAAKQALRAKQIDVAFVRNDPDATASGRASADRGLTLLAPVTLEPLGLYSSKITKLADLENGGEVLIPDDPVKSGRALRMLEQRDVVQLREGAGSRVSTRDITANPGYVRINEVSAKELARGYDGGLAVVLDANAAREAGLTSGGKPLALETGEDNPYVDGLFVRMGDEQDPQTQTLVGLVRSPSVKAYIEDTYHRMIMPAF